MRNRGSLYASIMVAVFALAAVTIIYIIFDQIYEYNIQPHGVRKGVDATNAELIDTAWTMLPIPILIAVVFGMWTAGRETRGGQMQ